MPPRDWQTGHCRDCGHNVLWRGFAVPPGRCPGCRGDVVKTTARGIYGYTETDAINALPRKEDA